MTSETLKVDIISDEFLKPIFEAKDELLQKAVINRAMEALKKKVYEHFNRDIYELVEHGSTKYRLNLERKNIYNMSEDEVKALFNTCIIHSIASFGTNLLIGGQPVVLN